MKTSNILAICKFSKIEYDKRKYKLNFNQLIDKYKREGIEYDMIIESHLEQQKCIHLARDLLPESTFIYTPDLKKEDTINKELIVSIGGDEHFKYVVHNSIEGKLFLNVRSDNLKSEGALSTCNRYNLEEMVHQIRTDSYLLDEWATIKAEINGNTIEKAIDTIYIGEGNSTRISRYFIFFQGDSEEQKSSGLLIVTGAGSTGWFQSAGGIPYPRNSKLCKFLSREIFVGTRTGSSIRKGEFVENGEIEVHSLMENGIVEIDSIRVFPFRRGDKIKVRVSDYYLQVALLNPH